MRIGAGYIRVSTTDQVEFSPNAQRKAILDYAKKNEIIIPEQYIFFDDGYSGKVAEKRPAFMKMIKAAKSNPKPFDLIIVHRFDRFARNREDSVIYKSLLKKEYDIRVISVTEQLEDDKFSIILESMLEAMAEYYSLNLSDEVKKGMLEKASRGEFQTRPPYGYEVINGKLVIAESEAGVVRMIFNRFINDDIPLVNIARELNRLGYKTKSNNNFETRSIKRILTNHTYMGYVRWNMKSRRNGKLEKNSEDHWIIAKSDHDVIVTEEMWQDAQLKMQTNKKRFSMQAIANDNTCKHWLRSVLKCAYCGGAMVYGKASTNNYAYFRCNNKSKGKCNQSNYVSINKLEDAIINQIGIDLMELKFIVKKNPTKSNNYEQDLLHKQLSIIDTKLNRAREAFLAGIDSMEEYKANKVKLTKEREDISHDYHQTSGEIKTTRSQVSSIKEFLIDSKNSMEDRNKAIKSIINKIIVDGPNQWIEINYYVDDI